MGRPESWPSAARLCAGPRLLVPAAAWPRTARGAGVSRWVSRPWQEPRWSPSCWARCHLSPAGARGARDTTSFVPRPVACGDSPASGLVWRGTPSAHPRFPLRVPQDGAPRPCTPPVPEADGALSPASARPRVVTQAGQAGLAPWGARLGPLGTRPSRWSCPRCPAPGARLGVLCDPAYPVGVGGLPPTLARTCLHCPATPPCAPRAGSVISAEPPDPPLLAGASSTCSPTWPRRCTRPGCWPSSSSHRLSPPGKCRACSGQGASPVSIRPLRAGAVAAMLSGVKTRAGDPRPRSKAASGPSACHWLGPHQGRCGRWPWTTQGQDLGFT